MIIVSGGIIAVEAIAFADQAAAVLVEDDAGEALSAEQADNILNFALVVLPSSTTTI